MQPQQPAAADANAHKYLTVKSQFKTQCYAALHLESADLIDEIAADSSLIATVLASLLQTLVHNSSVYKGY